MVLHKTPRQKGKFSLTRYLQTFQPGDFVAVAQELSFPLAYSKRIQGKTGKVIALRGKAYEVEISDLGKPKRYFIHPIHLKKINIQAK